MSLNVKEITKEQSWYEVETVNGTTYLTYNEIGEFDLDNVLELKSLKEKLGNTIKGKIVYLGTKVGVGARLTDDMNSNKTPWLVYPEIAEATQSLEDLYQIELEDDYGDDDY